VAQVSALEFWVSGRPAPQGSKRHVGNGRMLEMSKYVAGWRAAVKAEATRQAAGWVPLDEPCWLRVGFYLARPKAPKFPDRPGVTPDLSKLVRATEDALTGVAWSDDSRVVSTLAEKFWAGDLGPGAFIRVSTEELRKGAA